MVDHLLENRAGNQRNIPEQNQHTVVSIALLQAGQRLAYRMPCAQLFLLRYPVDAGVRMRFFCQCDRLLRTDTDHHVNRIGRQAHCRVQNAQEHRSSPDWVQHLGECGMHAGTLAGSKNDDFHS